MSVSVPSEDEIEKDIEPGPSKKAKRYTVYSDNWENNPDYAKWIKKKDEYNATCKLCQVDISIKYEGSRGLDKHRQTKKHSKLVLSQKISGNLQNFLVKKESTLETEISKAELMYVFHNVTHGLSYNSLDCQLKLASSVYSDSKIASKMSCGRTKAAAITRNVLGSFAQEQVVTELKEAKYFSVGSDASNVGNVKTYPYSVQYFNVETGISKKLLDFYEDPFESSKDIFGKIKQVTEENDLKLTQLTAYSADNASVNYGVNNSVFQKLRETNNHLIKANCNCHVINNCVKYALKALSVDIESIVIKTFNEFSSSSTKTEKLKECFLFASLEYKNLLRHVPTRWLSLMPALDRLIRSWPAIKQYFLLKGANECRKEIWDFVSKNLVNFDNNGAEEIDTCKQEGISEAYLYFVHNIMSEFQIAILALESNTCTILEIDSVMKKLMNQLQNRLDDKFFGSKNKTLLKNFSELEKNIFCAEAELFLTRAIQYLKERYNFSEDSLFKKLSVFSLKSEKLFSWEELSLLPELLNILSEVDQDGLYTDYCCLKEIFQHLQKKNTISNDKIWAYFFKKCSNNNMKNFKKIVSFVLSIPVSNAYCERVFSLLNNLYTNDRNRMGMDLIKAELLIRLNFENDCLNFKNILQTAQGSKLLDSAKANTKYMWQRKK